MYFVAALSRACCSELERLNNFFKKCDRDPDMDGII